MHLEIAIGSEYRLLSQSPTLCRTDGLSVIAKRSTPLEFHRLRQTWKSSARQLALAFVFLWFLIGGVAHFVATDMEMRIVPPYIPWPRAVVWASGGFELLGAAGVLWRSTRRAAGIGLIALTIAVTPAHIYMLQEPELFPNIPYWALFLRLPIQAALLALIAWSTVFADPQPR